MPITGKNLIAWGIQPGPKFKVALGLAKDLETAGVAIDAIKARIVRDFPAPVVIKRRASCAFAKAISAVTAVSSTSGAMIRSKVSFARS